MKKNTITTGEESVSLSVRSCVFLAGLTVTWASLITRSENVPVTGLCVVAMIAFWAGAMYFWQRPSLKHVNLPVNLLTVLIAVTVAEYAGADLDAGEYIYLLPLAAGLTALGSESDDGKTTYERIDLTHEMILPMALSVAAMAPSVIVCVLGERKVTSVAVIISALTLVLMAALASHATGRKIRFSSPVLKDFSATPSASMENARAFVIARALFGAGILPAFAVAYACRKIYDTYLAEDFDRLIIIIPLGVTLVMTLVAFGSEKLLSRSGRKGGAFCIYEAIAAVAFVSLPFIKNDALGTHGLKTALLLIFYILAIIMADTLATGYLTAYKRRSIFSDRPAPADGLPLMLIVAGIAIMCVEAVTLL